MRDVEIRAPRHGFVGGKAVRKHTQLLPSKVAIHNHNLKTTNPNPQRPRGRVRLSVRGPGICFEFFITLLLEDLGAGLVHDIPRIRTSPFPKGVVSGGGLRPGGVGAAGPDSKDIWMEPRAG